MGKGRQVKQRAAATPPHRAEQTQHPIPSRPGRAAAAAVLITQHECRLEMATALGHRTLGLASWVVRTAPATAGSTPEPHGPGGQVGRQEVSRGEEERRQQHG